MKYSLLAVTVAGALALAGTAVAQDQGQGKGDCPGGHGGWHGQEGMRGHGMMFEHMTESLNLTADQQAKVKPILDAARPQMIAIHQEAMQKTKAVMDDTMSKIRPLLTPEQQKKADDIKAAHEEMHDAAKKLHDAKSR
jgi:Spy/CpxP family protein refolding chaperone